MTAFLYQRSSMAGPFAQAMHAGGALPLAAGGSRSRACVAPRRAATRQRPRRHKRRGMQRARTPRAVVSETALTLLARARDRTGRARRDRPAAARTGCPGAAGPVLRSSARARRGAPSCRSRRPGATIVPRMACTVGPPTQSSRGASSAARTIASATGSGAWIGGTGCSRRGRWLRAQSNCGVSTAGSCTMVSRIAAALVEQFAAQGIREAAHGELWPRNRPIAAGSSGSRAPSRSGRSCRRSRGRIWRRAASVPWTCPR